MATRAKGGAWKVAGQGTATVMLGALLALGCGGGSKKEAVEKKPAASEEKPAHAQTSSPARPATLQAAPAKSSPDPFLHQSFTEATLAEPPEGQYLPEKTMTNKSVGKLYLDVQGLWGKILFTKADGKKIQYRATLDTEWGPIDIEFRPDIAPNHVRSFLALARAGYYDGLVFERTVHMVADNDPEDKLDYVQAGCPLGSGEENFGSIGYWLKPEFSKKVHHEEGTVGTWHQREADTAACKFYITLGKAPVMDGNFTIFGKVTKGLAMVRKIADQPLRKDDETKDHPEHPVVIKKVTIHTQEVDP
jgi:cyclophilin family peptidyl-prolyl cis-trans isomerase